MSAATREVREDQHGTRTGYAYGCRCRRCKGAAAAYRAGRKAVGIGADAPQHGTASGYTDYKCRCPRCKQAHSDYQNTRLFPVTNEATQGTIRQWGTSLGLPINSRGALPKGLIDRWNREHPERQYGGA